MSLPERWNSVRFACFARLSLTGLNPASLRHPSATDLRVPHPGRADDQAHGTRDQRAHNKFASQVLQVLAWRCCAACEAPWECVNAITSDQETRPLPFPIEPRG